MDIKLRSNKSWQALKNIIMTVAVIITLILTAIILSGIPHEYNPYLVALVFVSGALSIVLATDFWLVKFDDKYADLKYEEYYRALKRRCCLAQAIPLIYIVLMTFILCTVKLDVYSTYLLEELLSYNMEWIIIMLFLVPVLSFELTMMTGKEKRCERLILNMKKVTEEAVRESLKNERLKIDLITNVSHDLKTPLTSITGYIELMKKEDMTDILKDYVGVISAKTGVLKDMIEKMFDLAKASSGNIQYNCEKLQMNRMIKQIAADMEDSIAESGKAVKLELTDEDTSFMADSSYMYRVCQNIFENSLKYSLDGTRIFVRTKRTEEQVILEVVNVANYQMNFDKETIKERFVRADESRTTAGNGLGLAIVETYTNAFGGSFDIAVEGDVFKAILGFKAVS